MEGIFFEIEFTDGTKRIIDSRAVMQYRFYPSENRVSPDGWGCGIEYMISSLSHNKAIVLGTWTARGTLGMKEEEVINTANIRTIKPV